MIFKDKLNRVIKEGDIVTFIETSPKILKIGKVINISSRLRIRAYKSLDEAGNYVHSNVVPLSELMKKPAGYFREFTSSTTSERGVLILRSRLK